MSVKTYNVLTVNLSLAVGQLVVGWAFVETMLDMCIAVVYQSIDCTHIEPEIPRSTERKVEFLKKMIKTHRKLTRFQNDLSLLSTAKSLANMRHTVVHGVISEYDDRTGTVLFVMLDAKPKRHEEVRRKLSFKTMLAAGGRCLDLRKALHDLGLRLIKALVPKNKAKNFIRPFGGEVI
jgi:hypothetical protein